MVPSHALGVGESVRQSHWEPWPSPPSPHVTSQMSHSAVSSKGTNVCFSLGSVPSAQKWPWYTVVAQLYLFSE